MSSFWTSDDKIPVKQTKISIPAENGLDYKQNQLIHITIPPNVRFIQPKETYLKMDLQVECNEQVRLFLDAQSGAQCLIKDIRIYSGGAGGQLLEEIQDYNVITALRYDYEATDSIRQKRALTEGVSHFNPQCRGTFMGLKSDLNNVNKNPFNRAYKSDNQVSDTTFGTGAGEELGNQKIKVLLPLHTGIFQNDRVFPSLLTEGLRCEILLEKASKCVRVLDTTSRLNRVGWLPLLHSVGETDTDGGVDYDTTSAVEQGWGNTTLQKIQYVWLRRDNSLINKENVPFVVGEYIDLINVTKNPLAATADARGLYVGGSTLYDCVDPASPSGITDVGLLRISEIKFFAGDPSDGSVQGGRYGLTRLTLEQPAYSLATSPVMNGASGEWAVFSRSIASRQVVKTGLSAPTITFNYQLSNVELIVQELEMPQGYVNKLMGMMKQNGTLNYDFLSHTNYKYSQLKNDVVANIRLPLNQSRAKAILSVPADSSIYGEVAQVTGSDLNWGGGTSIAGGQKDYNAYSVDDYSYNNKNVLNYDDEEGVGGNGTGVYCADWWNNSVRSGLVGVWDNLKQYQWFYNGKLNPSRQIDCSAVATGGSLSQAWCIEAEKALAMSGIKPLSFKMLHESAFLGRALALQNGVYDTRGRDFNLQVEYSASGVKNHLWHNFVAHIRRMSIRGNQIALSV